MKPLACSIDSIGHGVHGHRAGAARRQAGHNIRASNILEVYLGSVVDVQHEPLEEYKLVECCSTVKSSRDTHRTMLYSTSSFVCHEQTAAAPLPHMCPYVEAMGERPGRSRR